MGNKTDTKKNSTRIGYLHDDSSHRRPRRWASRKGGERNMVETIEGVSYTPNWEQRQEIVKILMNDYRSFIRTERGQKLMSSCK